MAVISFVGLSTADSLKTRAVSFTCGLHSKSERKQGDGLKEGMPSTRQPAVTFRPTLRRLPTTSPNAGESR